MIRTSLIRNAAAGLLMLVLGAFFVLGALDIELGTSRNLGPGFFPLALGIILVGTAVTILIFERSEEEEASKGATPRTMLLILASVILFGLLAPNFGLLPAVAGAAFVSALADLRTTLKSATVSALVITCLSWLVFKLGLGLPIASLKVFDRWIF